ncbi:MULTISPECIES: hypothetical protein [unclassified Mesorhizobium]|uniref:hypothetical protein n=2 Tax=unclassified Mesorhizobium TaxID=325217 RepID=UPI001FE029A8|nr:MULTISPECIES: hypothetical protein [unclassified Mesorhizobium]
MHSGLSSLLQARPQPPATGSVRRKVFTVSPWLTKGFENLWHSQAANPRLSIIGRANVPPPRPCRQIQHQAGAIIFKRQVIAREPYSPTRSLALSGVCPMLDRCSHNQAIYPDDLSALKRVFDELCREADISLESIEASDIAAELVRLFQTGVADATVLKIAVRSRNQTLRQAG